MLLSICQNTFQSLVELEAVDSLRVEVRECYAEITKTSEQIQSTVRENYLSKDDLTTIEVGSMGQQKTTINPLLATYEKQSARVTDDLYNLGLTARKQAAKTDDQRVDDNDPMKQYYQTK